MSEFDGEYHFSGETVQDDGKKPKRTRKAPDIAGKAGKIGKIILAVVAALLVLSIVFGSFYNVTEQENAVVFCYCF